MTIKGIKIMKDRSKLVLNKMELKTLCRVLNALGSVPFVRAQKPAFDFSAIEKHLRSSTATATTDEAVFVFDVDEIEQILKAINVVFIEYPDDSALHLYLGSQRGEITQVKSKFDALIHAPA